MGSPIPRPWAHKSPARTGPAGFSSAADNFREEQIKPPTAVSFPAA